MPRRWKKEKRVGAARPQSAITMALATSMAREGNCDGSNGDPTHPRMGRLRTIFASDRSSDGFMFDVRTEGWPIVVRGVDVNTDRTRDDGETRVEIWYKVGSFRGHEGSQDTWTLWMNDTIIGNGTDVPTHIPPGVFRPMSIKAYEKRAFYVDFPEGPYLRHTSPWDEELYGYSDLMRFYGYGAAKYGGGGFDGATRYPRLFNGGLHYTIYSEPRPTYMPTYYPTAAPTATAEPVANRTSAADMSTNGTSAPFRLRMDWRREYYWQESYRKRDFCMECYDECTEGSSIYVDNCYGWNERQQLVSMGETLRPAHNSSLCLTVTGYRDSKPIRVYECAEGGRQMSRQQFVGLTPNGRFALQPKEESDRCVSQLHHPKEFERVYAKDCDEARRHNSIYWVVY